MIREQLLGSWRPLEWTWHDESGEVESPLGGKPAGLLMYDDAGKMSVQLMRPDRAEFADNDFRNAEPDEKISAWNGYFCYFGSYSVDEETRTVTHRVEGSLFPNYVGTEQVRKCAISGNRLTLIAEAAWGRVELVWERVTSVT